MRAGHLLALRWPKKTQGGGLYYEWRPHDVDTLKPQFPAQIALILAGDQVGA